MAEFETTIGKVKTSIASTLIPAINEFVAERKKGFDEWKGDVNSAKDGIDTALSFIGIKLGETDKAMDDTGVAATVMAAQIEQAAKDSAATVGIETSKIVTSHMEMVKANRNHADRVDALTKRRIDCDAGRGRRSDEDCKCCQFMNIMRMVDANAITGRPCGRPCRTKAVSAGRGS